MRLELDEERMQMLVDTIDTAVKRAEEAVDLFARRRRRAEVDYWTKELTRRRDLLDEVVAQTGLPPL